jgi:hypothetical protein
MSLLPQQTNGTFRATFPEELLIPVIGRLLYSYACSWPVKKGDHDGADVFLSCTRSTSTLYAEAPHQKLGDQVFPDTYDIEAGNQFSIA